MLFTIECSRIKHVTIIGSGKPVQHILHSKNQLIIYNNKLVHYHNSTCGTTSGSIFSGCCSQHQKTKHLPQVQYQVIHSPSLATSINSNYYKPFKARDEFAQQSTWVGSQILIQHSAIPSTELLDPTPVIYFLYNTHTSAITNIYTPPLSS